MTPNQILKETFGYDSFRSGQEPLINAMLEGQDTLGIMPTGAGKSLCFQVPALMMEGITLVVSPLISLMQDQVKSLIQSGVRAAYINSALTPKQIDRALYNARIGTYKIIYVAPERLLSENFLAFAQSVNISMLTVDEAHCISQWGQDFRPSYAQIPAFVQALPRRPVVSAFTATATQQVKDDVIALLKLNQPLVTVTGFNRENLYFEVQKSTDKSADLMDFLEDREDSVGIVYCATRKLVEQVCGELNSNGFSAAMYHAGLPQKERQENQNRFLFDAVNIIVATNAFGMGIDKSNVRFVVHYNMPKDLESYYQEAGRGGRDGAPAHCLLLYSPRDVVLQRWMIDHSKDTLCEDEALAEELREREHNRLKLMTFYATTSRCLRQSILRYFGERTSDRCDNCSSCTGQSSLKTALTSPNKHYTDAPNGKKPKRTPVRSVPAGREGLYEQLRALRTELAKKQSVPAFVVFSDASLMDMCDKLPTTLKEFGNVSGVGQQKLEKYGKDMVDVIKAFCTE